jgi:hypothetical protein
MGITSNDQRRAMKVRSDRHLRAEGVSSNIGKKNTIKAIIKIARMVPAVVSFFLKEREIKLNQGKPYGWGE